MLRNIEIQSVDCKAAEKDKLSERCFQRYSFFFSATDLRKGSAPALLLIG